jgi:hypothetical protein
MDGLDGWMGGWRWKCPWIWLEKGWMDMVRKRNEWME